MKDERLPKGTPYGGDIYDAQGKLREDKARKAYLDMLERFNYPIPERF